MTKVVCMSVLTPVLNTSISIDAVAQSSVVCNTHQASCNTVVQHCKGQTFKTVRMNNWHKVHGLPLVYVY